MPVIIELEKKLLRQRLGDATEVFTERAMEQRIKGGLRATLETESLVTGVLYIEIHMHPNAPPPVFHQLEKRYPEIPSIPTKIQQLMDNLASPGYEEPADEPERADHPARRTPSAS